MKNYNSTHPLQSLQWGEFREKTGIKVIRMDNFQMTIHKIPYTSWTIGYVPKGPVPTKEMVSKLKEVGKKEKCILIQLEPNVETNSESGIKNQEWSKFQTIIHNSQFMIRPAAHPLFTKYTFILDLTKSEEDLLKNMHSKTRYNIKVAIKHGVKIIEDNSDQAFEEYLNLTKETTKRQDFYAHTERYHRLMWETLRVQNSESRIKNLNKNRLTAHLFLAKYNPSSSNSELLTMNSKLQARTLATWIVFAYKDALYYPYGASSSLYRETMASNLMMWEVIRFGKKLGVKKFDMWGALGPNPNPKDPWFGFHKFKQGYGSELTEFVGSYDLVINPVLYEVYKILDKLRWLYLRFK